MGISPNTNGGNVISQRLTAAGAFWGEIHDALEQLGEARVAPFDGLSEEKAQRCLAKSNIIDCVAGDRLLEKGNLARNMFVELDARGPRRQDPVAHPLAG